MVTNIKNKEFLEKMEEKKIIIETQFANIERYLNDNEELDYNSIVNILSTFNTLQIKYEQLCEDLELFMTIFLKKDEREFRVYKTEELVDTIEKAVNKVQNKSN